VAIEAQKQKECHPLNLTVYNYCNFVKKYFLPHFLIDQHSSVVLKSFQLPKTGRSRCKAARLIQVCRHYIPYCFRLIPGTSKLLKSHPVGLPETKNQQGRKFDEICRGRICICKESEK